jgi:hypothetical protein
VVADGPAPAWAALLGAEMEALAEAQLGQFQEQLAEMGNEQVRTLVASESLAWLPPAGFLEGSGARQLDWKTFLGSHQPLREVPLAAGDLRGVLAAALRRDPVQVGSATRYRVYSINGSTQKLFVREAPNAPHAEEVWLDGARAGFDGVSDVQEAITRLRARSCRQIVLWPAADLYGLLAKLPAGGDVTLCFEPGNYELKRPIQLVGLGRLTIHGPGARLRIESSECALLVHACQSVEVSGLSLRADGFSAGKDPATGRGLYGALSVFDTPAVRIDGVTARCSGGPRVTCAGIVVSNLGPAMLAPSTVSISGCELAIAIAQIGILCVNTEVAFISRNRVTGGLGSETYCLQRGIVVAGQRAGQVRIEDNVILFATEGIGIGLSKEETGKSEALRADRVVVARNSVVLRINTGERNRRGIFVGNANSVLVEGNHVIVEGRKLADVEVDGVLLSGIYGRSVVVRGNHFEGPRTGITFVAKEDGTTKLPLPGTPPDRVWLFQFNVAESAIQALFVSPTALGEVVIAEHNIPPGGLPV